MGNNLYIRLDSDNGVLTNEEDIFYYKATQDVEIISNYLLGDFNEDGEYIINEDIIEELVEIPKGVTNEFSNMFFCVSHVVTDYVETEKFVVKTRYDDEDPSIKISTLEVLEDIKKVEGYIVNSLSTPIAEFVDFAGDNYKEKMFNAFNIIDKDQLSNSQIDKFAHGQISLRRKFVASIEKICNPQLEEVHKQAYLKKLEILKKSGKVGEDTIKLFEDRLKNKPIIATKNNYKALNELLDSVIEVHKEQLKPVMPEIRKVGVEFAEKVEQIQKLSFQNLKNIQKTPLAIKTIQTQQDAVFNNKLAKKTAVKQIITKEVKETDYKKKETYNIVQKQEQFEVKPQNEPKKERVNILKTLFGLGEKREEKQNKKEEKITKKPEEPKKSLEDVNSSSAKKETDKITTSNTNSNKNNAQQSNSNNQNTNKNKQNIKTDINNTEILGKKEKNNQNKDAQLNNKPLNNTYNNESVFNEIKNNLENKEKNNYNPTKNKSQDFEKDFIDKNSKKNNEYIINKENKNNNQSITKGPIKKEEIHTKEEPKKEEKIDEIEVAKLSKAGKFLKKLEGLGNQIDASLDNEIKKETPQKSVQQNKDDEMNL